jgi:hypothetical protein
MTCRILSTNEPIRITIQSGHRVLRTIGHTNTQQKGRLDTCHVYTSQSEFEEQYSYEYHKRERGVAMIRRRRIQNEWQLLRTAGHFFQLETTEYALGAVQYIPCVFGRDNMGPVLISPRTLKINFPPSWTTRSLFSRRLSMSSWSEQGNGSTLGG